MEGMRPASVEWYVEAFEKVADIHLKYADTMDVDLTEDDRRGVHAPESVQHILDCSLQE